MLRFLFLPALLLLAAPAVRAQSAAALPAASAPCNCAQSLGQMRQLIEANYAGYTDKVTPATRPRLDSLTRVVQARADTARAASCGLVLYEWLTFFQDGHLQIKNDQPLPQLDPATIRARFVGAPRLPWTRASFRAYLDDPARPKQPLEGIWRDAGNNYSVGVVAAGQPAHYQAFVLRADSVWWVPGQVKFAFATPTAAGPATGTYRMQNHEEQLRRVTLPAEGVIQFDDSPWYRVYPRPVAVPPAPARVANHRFQMLDDTTALYRIASFDGQYRPLIDSLTKANAANLRRTRLLILDLRYNGGGSDGSYRSLTPYLYTQPVQTVGVALRSTPLNNAKYNGALYPDMSVPEKLFIAQLRRRLDAHPGQLIKQRPNSDGVSVQRLSRRRQHPEVARVAILQNRGCGSTTEQFLLEARQSGKVTLFGENSAGVLDYANMQFAPLLCPGLRLGWATSRTFRLDRNQGIDGVGIAPTVRLNPNAPDMVEQVRTWYRQPGR
ncbi:S41 family peptidase [Hymenobacter psychrophilus]|uniref:Peptidase family S41 n=1 Tax=Hymenobacter psychrophilus TaxID=651662 RepID=A0A1H3I252_9BACT|nr:S41 family peptidase [Hymenobacter psychrophilus]SDY21495.1 Peptidase family S41 [Hymenobacter psychrophilus]